MDIYPKRDLSGLTDWQLWMAWLTDTVTSIDEDGAHIYPRWAAVLSWAVMVAGVATVLWFLLYEGTT